MPSDAVEEPQSVVGNADLTCLNTQLNVWVLAAITAAGCRAAACW